MDLVSWALFAAVVIGALAMVLHLYLRREAPGRGRRLLAGLRWLVLTLLVLLLFDPELPAPGLAAGGGRTQVLVDASLSMALPAAPGDSLTRWQVAARQAARLAGGGPVLLFGDVPRLAPADSLDGLEPTAPSSRLLPALRAASEAGVRRAIVLTDGGIDDAGEVQRTLAGLGMDVEFRPITEGEVANRALAEVEAPLWAEAGKPLRIQVGVAAEGAGGDSVTVEVRQDGRTLATTSLEAPESGRVSGAALEFEPEAPPGGGLVRYDLVLSAPDAAPDDDVRSVYIYVGERPAGVALVSLRPDWEPRFLMPVLEQALGIPVRGFLGTTAGKYVELGAGPDAGKPADEATVRRVVERADLVVLHGLDDDSPDWALAAARNARRVLIFPAPSNAGAGLPITLSAATPGEWYASAEVPASPVAPMLTHLPASEMPPLSGLRTVGDLAGAWSALMASRGRGGTTSPVVVAGEAGGRRWAVATAEGFWRWAFRGGEARQAYRRLWGALGGWLVQEDFAAGGAAIRPVHNTAARGEPIEWIAAGLAPDSIALTVTDAEGAVVADTVIAGVRGDSVRTSALPPGHYRYVARAFAGDEEVGAAEGPFSVDGYSPEFLRRATALDAVRAADIRPVARAGRGPSQPLHTLPWPYLALVLLVASEWILRRRWGLR